MRLEPAGRVRDLAVFNMAVDTELRGCDLVRLQGADVLAAGRVKERASVVRSRTQRPVRFEITETAWEAAHAWIDSPATIGSVHLWPSRFHDSPHVSTRQYGRMLKARVAAIGPEPSAYGTHSIRRTKAAQIHKKTGNPRAVQQPLGHTRMDSTVRYLGVELEDALAISEGVDL